MKKIPNKCHQGALLNHNNFRVISAGIALKIEFHHPCHQLQTITGKSSTALILNLVLNNKTGPLSLEFN